MHPVFAAKVVLVTLIAGIALLLAGQWFGVVFLVLIPLAVYSGVRAWRQGHRF